MTPAEALGVEALEEDDERLRLDLVREGRRLSQCREALDRALERLAETTRAYERLVTVAARAALEVARLRTALDSVQYADHIGDAYALAADALRYEAVPEGMPGIAGPANYTLEVQRARLSARERVLPSLPSGTAAVKGEPGAGILGESEPDVAPAKKIDGLKSVELCAGAGGQALGLHWAGFNHVALVEWDKDACATLRHNGRQWGWDECVHQADVRRWRPDGDLGQIALVSAGVPCPPFSIAGKQLGSDDERDLFPALLDVVDLLRPRAVQAENVRGLLGRRFDEYRAGVANRLGELGYVVHWRLLNACDFGVAQLRPRTVMVALSPADAEHFRWPDPALVSPPTVGEVLIESMRSRGWEGAEAWARLANQIAPTLVGGSRKHGGPDLGPTRARHAWARMGVNGLGIAADVPGPGFDGMPKLTTAQAALLQGFPADWEFQGRKTSAYRQVGNAFPPPVAEAVGGALLRAFAAGTAAGEAAAQSGTKEESCGQ